MPATPICQRRYRGLALGGVLLLALALPGLAPAQQSDTSPAPAPPDAPAGEIEQTGCTSCGGGLAPPILGNLFGGAGCNCGAGKCVPGQEPCCPCYADHAVGRFFCGLYQCICCPDPCYEPRWLPLADSAFFVDSARPKTMQRVRWDSGQDLVLPDRNEYFWARADGNGKGPRPPSGALGEVGLRYNDLSLYTEAATGAASITVEMPYRVIDPIIDAHAAGFADITLGTKALLFDCELLQLTFEFKTTLPSGNFNKGLGAGHVSLEPSLVVGIKVAPDTYFQGQLSEWIPLGGDPNYQGSILHYHASLNQVLYRILPDVPIIGTCEANGWSFQDGAYTDPFLGALQKSSGETYVTAGPGIRLFVCDKIDFGFGAQFAVSSGHFARQLYRSEFRWRF